MPFEILGTRRGAVIVGRSAWSSLPAAANYSGLSFALTDTWANGLTATSDGTNWKLSGLARFKAGAPNDVVTGVTARTLLREVTIPGNLMGPLGVLRANILFSCTNSANAKNLQTFIYQTAGGIAGGTIVGNTSGTNQATWGSQILVRNTSATSQVANTGNTIGSLGASSVAAITPAVDTTQDWILAMGCTPVSASDTVTLLQYTIDIDQRF